MKKVLSLLSVATCLLLFSCAKKSDAPATRILQGKWKMVDFADSALHTHLTKPVDYDGEAELTFTFTGTVYGNFTAKNKTEQVNGTFLENNGALNFATATSPVLADQPWGNNFMYTIGNAVGYTLLADGKLVIISHMPAPPGSGNYYALTFQKE